jgi:hypothetical protein
MRALDGGSLILLNEGVGWSSLIRLIEGAESVLAVRRKPRWLEYGRSICLGWAEL